jgi:hypothetical protein
MVLAIKPHHPMGEKQQEDRDMLTKDLRRVTLKKSDEVIGE